MTPAVPWHRRLLLSPTITPLVFFLFCVVVIALAMHNTQQAHRSEVRQETAVTAEQVKLRLEAWVDNRTAIQEHLGSPSTGHGQFEGDQFSIVAEEIVQLYPGFQALNFIDPDWVIRMVVPSATNQAALNKNLHMHPNPGVPRALQRAIDTNRICRSPLILLLQGKPGFATYLPLRDEDGHLRGILNGVFVMDQLVESCLGEEKLRSRFALTITTAEGEVAYRHRPAGLDTRHPDLAQSVPLRIVDRNWNLTLEPAMVITGIHADGHSLLMVGGLLLALALSLLLRAYLKRVAELAASREDFITLVEAMQEIVLKHDLDFRIFFINPAGQRLLQMPEEEILGRSALDFVDPLDHEILHQFQVDLEVGQPPEQTELRVQTPSGLLWTSWTSSAILDERGELQGVVSVGRDISRARELEHQLRQSQKLLAVGQLAGGIAHDFNNIIQAVLGYLGFAKSALDPASQEHKDLEQAEVAAERAATLTRQLLAFSRRQMLQPVQLDLNQVVAEMLPMLHRLLGEAIELDFQPSATLARICADRSQVEQILVNLGLNARDAIGDAVGLIRIGTEPVSLDQDFCRQNSWAVPGDWVCLEIADTGCGMDPGLLPQIFEPFFTTKETGKGTGLGLATVYGIVKQHDGLITVKSEPSVGTTFSIYLQASEGPLDEETDTPASTEYHRDGTILLVEDQDQVRDMTQRILEKVGFKVIAAANGEEALEIWLENKGDFDLVVLDVVMPRMGGRELAAKLRKDRPRQPILFISGYDADSLQEPLVIQSHEDFLPKPFRRNDLLDRVRRLLDG